MNLSQDRINEICELCFGTVIANSPEREIKEYNRDFIDHNKSYIENAYRKVIASGEHSKGALSDMYSAVLKQAKADKYYDILMKPDQWGNEWAFSKSLKNGSKILTHFIDILDSEIIADEKRGISIRESLRCTTEDSIELEHYWELDDPEWPSDILDHPENLNNTLDGKPLSFLEKVLGTLGCLSETLSKWLEKMCGKDKKSDVER